MGTCGTRHEGKEGWLGEQVAAWYGATLVAEHTAQQSHQILTLGAPITLPPLCSAQLVCLHLHSIISLTAISTLGIYFICADSPHKIDQQEENIT